MISRRTNKLAENFHCLDSDVIVFFLFFFPLSKIVIEYCHVFISSQRTKEIIWFEERFPGRVQWESRSSEKNVSYSRLILKKSNQIESIAFLNLRSFFYYLCVSQDKNENNLRPSSFQWKAIWHCFVDVNIWIRPIRNEIRIFNSFFLSMNHSTSARMHSWNILSKREKEWLWRRLFGCQ